MSLSFPHLTKEDIMSEYNALGLLWGVPVYMNVYAEEDDKEQLLIDTNMEEMNWVPRPLFFLALLLTSILAVFMDSAQKELVVPIVILKMWVRRE